MKKSIALLLSLAALGPLSAQAEITWYGGFGLGGSRVEEDIDLTFTASEYVGEDLVPVSSSTLDKFNGTDLGMHAFAGVRFGPYFGIEGGYVDLGQPDDELELNIPNVGPSCPVGCRPETDIQLVLEDEFTGWEVFALGVFPITERWEVFAKVGAIAWDSTFTITNAFADQFPPSPPDTVAFIPTTSPTSSKIDTDGTDLAGGLGFDYKVSDRLTLRGQGTWYDIEDTEQVWMLGFDIIIAL